MASEGFIEGVAEHLGGRISEEIEWLHSALTPPPFQTKMSKREWFNWWRRHYADEHGKKALAGMKPADALKVEQTLAQMFQDAGMLAPPEEEEGVGF